MPDQIYHRLKKKPARGLEKFLGELELEIMTIVWEREPVSVSDVLTTLAEKKRDLAYTTIMTVMGRLVEKGWLTAEKRGRAHFYRAVRSRHDAEAEAVGEVVRALLQDFGEVAVAQFVKELDEIDPTQLARLAELAREAEREE